MVALALSNTNFDGLLAALIPAWASDNWASLFVQKNTAWKVFLENGRIQAGGFGSKIVYPTSFPTTTGPQTERIGTNVLAERTTSLMTGSTAAEYQPALYGIDYAMSLFEAAQFGSDTEKANWAQFNSQQALDRVNTFVEADWWAVEETANSGGNSNTRVGSLRTYINGGTTASTDGGATPPALGAQSLAGFASATSVTALTLIGNIQRSAAGAAYWSVPLISPSSSAALTIQQLDQTYELANTGDQEPDLIIVHRDLFSVLMNLSTFGGSNGGQIFNDNNEAQIGYKSLRYRNARIITDDDAPTAGFVSGTSTARNYNIMALNTKFLEWRMREKKPKFRVVDDPREIIRTVGSLMLAFCMFGAGRYHARHVNITAP